VYPPGNPHHVSEFVPAELTEELAGLFSQVALYRQDSLLGSTITDAQLPPRADVDVEPDLPAHFAAELKPGAERYFLIAASNHELPTLRGRGVFGDLFDVRWWQDRELELDNELAHAQAEHAEAQAKLAELEVEVERMRAEAAHEVELMRTRARKAETVLLALESNRAAELELIRQVEANAEAAKAALNEAHATIQAMHRTRIWRLGATWWRLRAWLFRRR
jgi:hypothetical protein